MAERSVLKDYPKDSNSSFTQLIFKASGPVVSQCQMIPTRPDAFPKVLINLATCYAIRTDPVMTQVYQTHFPPNPLSHLPSSQEDQAKILHCLVCVCVCVPSK